MKNRVSVTTPGKLILMGEHAAVYGRPALVAAVDPRTRVEVERIEGGLRVELIDFAQTLQIDWPTVRRRAREAAAAWARYAEAPSPERFARLDAGSPEALTVLTLGEIALATAGEPTPLAVRVRSRLPIGSGFGSSASIAVALIGGVLTLLETAEESRIDALALEVERRQHGLPSGVDHKTVLFGGVVLAERQGDGTLRIDRLPRVAPVLERLEIYQSGQPHETTGEVVAAVRRRRDEDPVAVEAILDRMGQGVIDLRDELAAEGPRLARVADLIRDYESCLEALGVVPPPVRETIRQVEAAGGAAKISGAGSLSGESAGCLLVHWPEGPPEPLPERLAGYSRQAVTLGTAGLRVEEQE